MRRVIVLHAPTPGHAAPEWERSLLARLPYARRLELESRAPVDRRASLAGTALLLEAAGHLGCGDVTPRALRFPEGGKPRMAGGPFFSVSHTARRVACAASWDCDVGLDHEDFAGETAPARLARWTAVEATLKAAGAGLERTHEVEVDRAFARSRLDGTEFHLVTLDLGPGLVACLAMGSQAHAIEVQCLEGTVS
jgi:phosphopantetheinyl transferase